MPVLPISFALFAAPDVGYTVLHRVGATALDFLALTFRLALEISAVLALAGVAGGLAARHTSLLARLDASGLPQRLMYWLNRNRRRRLGTAAAAHGVAAVTLVVAHPTLPASYVQAQHLPRQFGAWRDFELRACCQGQSQVAAILKDPGSDVELTLVMPRHHGFALAKLRKARKVRLTLEAPRSRVLTVRTTAGELLAAGALDPRSEVTLSRELS